MWKRIGLFVVIILVGSFMQSCKISYNFSGTNLSPTIKTYTVYYFPNRARLVNPTLSQLFTEDLREKMQRQTSLDEIQDNGDLIFEGQIEKYEVRPMSIQKEDLADAGHALVTLMHVIGDFANDIRILYSSDIGEVTSRDNAERLGGSSADAGKNNPINYENISLVRNSVILQLINLGMRCE